MNTMNISPFRFRQWSLIASAIALSACATPGNKNLETSAAVLAQQTTQQQPSVEQKPAGKDELKKTDIKAPPPPKLFKGTGVFVKGAPEDIKPAPAGNISLNFEGADIREVAKTILADILNESYMVDPKVQGSISLRTVRPLPRESLLSTLETLLKMNNATLVKEDGIYKILPGNALKGSVSPRMGGKLSGYSVQLIPLQFVGAREMAKILEPFASEGSILRVDEVRNILIIGGQQNELAHIMDTISTFDVDWISGMSVGLFTLQSADVKTVAAELDKILGEKSTGPLAGIIRAIPIERMNAFLIITPQPKYLDQAKLWIERLDRVGGSTGGQQLFVYHVQNGKAENLATLLNQAYGTGQTATQTGQGLTAARSTTPSLAPGLAPTEIRSSTQANSQPVASAPAQAMNLAINDGSGTMRNIRIIADKDNNALLVLSNGEEYEKIESALKRLDVPPRQVLIDVTIAEVSLTDDMSLGVEWTFNDGRKTGLLDTGDKGVGALTPGFSYVLRNATGSDIKAALNMLATDKRVNVLSSPHIMVADNQQAKIQVGDSVPTIGQSAILGGTTTNTITTSVQYIDTGIILTVTPRINASGLVTLEVQQEVSNASTTTTSGVNSPTISKRTAKSFVTVQSGETTVLGGLIQDNKTYATSGVPFLSEIPVLGALFGSQGVNAKKTELVVLITPKIAANVAQAKTISDEFRRKLTGIGEMMQDMKEREVHSSSVSIPQEK